MNESLLSAVLVVLGVAVVAWVLRASAVKRIPDPDPAARDDVERMLSEALENAGGIEDEEEPGGAIAALTSDGWAFVPDGDEVQLVPPGDADDILPVRSRIRTDNRPATDPDIQVMGGQGAPVNPRTGRRVSGWKPGEHLGAGDLIAARLQRGAPDHDPWRLEALGRDRELRAWRFETEEAARAALEMVERRIVRPPRGEDDEPVAIGDEDFAEARRIEEETEAELGSDWEEGEDDPERRPG
jgi:hypothetical protein